MVELTLLEVHFEDSNLTATTGRGSGEKEVRASDESDEEPTGERTGESGDESESGSSALRALVGLAFLVGVAYAARKRMQGDQQQEEEMHIEEDEDFEYTPAEA